VFYVKFIHANTLIIPMHPFVKILLFIASLVLIGIASAEFSSAMLAMLIVLIMLMKHKNYLQIMLRLRWLFLSIFLIYAFGTPGELVAYFPIQLAPSYEGLALGMFQLIRLLIALAALNLLLTDSPRQEMMLGLYLLLLPLKYVGLNVERFAARLMLTLHYVEALAENGKQSLNFDALDHVHVLAPEVSSSSVYIEPCSFKLLDKLILITMTVLMLAFVYWNMR
jgi:energy-coupling factor transporter transmembrane protein EcfT